MMVVVVIGTWRGSRVSKLLMIMDLRPPSCVITDFEPARPPPLLGCWVVVKKLDLNDHNMDI